MGGVCSRRAQKAKPDTPTASSSYEGLTPGQQVHAAACNGDVKHIEKLAAEGVDLNVPRESDGFMALDACAWSGTTEGAEALIRLGADPARTMQAVVGAAAWGNTDLLEAMLRVGGPVDQELSDSTALRWAVEMNQEESAEVLLRHGAWAREPQQAWVLMRLKRKRMARALDAVAKEDPDLAKDCELPPYWSDWSGCHVM